MPGLLHNILVSAEPDPATHHVRLAWQNGCVTHADFTPVMGQAVFAPLHDPGFFRQAHIADSGHVLAWPGELEFDADALWFEAFPEDASAVSGLPASPHP